MIAERRVRMIKAERQERIKEMVSSKGTVTIGDMVRELGVSNMTVRRDLDELSRDGQLVRVHGGACRVEPHHRSVISREYSHAEKSLRRIGEKDESAKTAASLIEPGETVFLGTGTTVERMVRYLPQCRLRIVTNSLSVFNLLSVRDEPELELVLTGGIFRKRTAAFVGPLAESDIRKIGIGTSFIGANGVCGNEVSTSNMEEGSLQRLAYESSDRRLLVVDSSKFGNRDFYVFYNVSDLDAIVCEGSARDEVVSPIQEFTKVIR